QDHIHADQPIRHDPPPTLAKFITSFNIYFVKPERKGNSQKSLRAFKKYSNMESYTQQFNIHTYDSTWRDNILVSLYRGGLKENIQLAIVSSVGHVFQDCPKKKNPGHSSIPIRLADLQ
ncbi:hypothetical protein VP01_6511g1, partial [Puccinia sorghi]